MVTIIKRIVSSLIIGLACFFGGILLAAISPLIAILALFRDTKKSQGLKVNFGKLEDEFKQITDPDWKRWRKDHDKLYNNDNEDSVED